MGPHDGHRQRLKTEFLARPDSFPDHKLLELLFFYANPRSDTNPLAHELIDRFGSLAGVLDAPPEELCKVKGMGKHGAVLLKTVKELSGRYLTARTRVDDIARNSRDYYQLLRPYFFGARNELLCLLCMDVWFDSGSTWAAVAAERPYLKYPADLYLEGGDQYRGWFQSSMLTSIAVNGVAPYKQIATHGWTVDGEGKAMHKSLGNGMDPAEIINEFGADMLRLWAGSADYHADMRCSKEIFKQLTQNYLKFRNTARYCLGNLDGFDAEHLVAPEDMLPLDRWAITKLNDLIRRVAKAYDNYEFHVVSHAINDFCVVELSSFYLDIIKDRLYCEERNGLKRRSAQTALFLILDSMTKMFAPILAFTCDEIWLAMPHRAEDDARNVLLNVMNQPFDAYALSEDELAKWDQLIRVRTDVNGVLEAARAEKRIGKPLEAAVTLRADDDAARAALDDVQSMNLPELLIVSQCLVGGDVPADAVTGTGTNFPGLHISVHNAPGTKCPRCWMHSEQADPETGLCPRCAAVVAAQKAE